MQKLIEAIRRYVTLDESDKQIILGLAETRELKKNEYFLEPGTICNNFAFIEKGLLRHSIFDDDGEEKTIYFSSDNDFICDIESFISRKTSGKSIMALEDTTLACISYANMQVFYRQVSSGERFGRLYMEEIYNKVINHIISMHTDSAQQKYQNFLSSYHHIQQRIPQYHIASFVGVTPQSLSRIRRKIVNR